MDVAEKLAVFSSTVNLCPSISRSKVLHSFQNVNTLAQTRINTTICAFICFAYFPTMTEQQVSVPHVPNSFLVSVTHSPQGKCAGENNV